MKEKKKVYIYTKKFLLEQFIDILEKKRIKSDKSKEGDEDREIKDININIIVHNEMEGLKILCVPGMIPKETEKELTFDKNEILFFAFIFRGILDFLNYLGYDFIEEDSIIVQ